MTSPHDTERRLAHLEQQVEYLTGMVTVMAGAVAQRAVDPAPPGPSPFAAHNQAPLDGDWTVEARCLDLLVTCGDVDLVAEVGSALSRHNERPWRVVLRRYGMPRGSEIVAAGTTTPRRDVRWEVIYSQQMLGGWSAQVLGERIIAAVDAWLDASGASSSPAEVEGEGGGS